MKPSTHPIFWRDDNLPYVELRYIEDGHAVGYAPHSHKEWSMGAILKGDSTFLYADKSYEVSEGYLVMMNPDVVHACNPCQGSPWSYYMMHIDSHWLASLLQTAGVRTANDFIPTSVDLLHDAHFYHAFVQLAEALMSDDLASIEKESLLKNYFVELIAHLDKQGSHSKPPNKPSDTIMAVADYLDQHYLEDCSLDQLSEKFGISKGYLVRSFNKHFAMSPHAYRLNRRVQLGQQALKAGDPIVEVAQDVGFSDQAHFQRTFKQRLAATPAQYRSVLKQDKKTTDR